MTERRAYLAGYVPRGVIVDEIRSLSKADIEEGFDAVQTHAEEIAPSWANGVWQDRIPVKYKYKAPKVYPDDGRNQERIDKAKVKRERRAIRNLRLRYADISRKGEWF